MPQTLCERCWEPLDDGAAACAFCGTAGPGPPGPVRRMRSRASRVTARARALPPRVSGVAVALLVLAVLAPLGWRLAGGAGTQAEPSEPAGAPGDGTTPGDSGEIATPGAAGLTRVRPREIPVGPACMVDDTPVQGRDCARWALRITGDRVTHLASDGHSVVAALRDGVVALDANTGAVRWHWREPRTRSRRAPVTELRLAGSRAVVVREAEHRIDALDLGTGQMAWSAPLAEKRQAWIAVTEEQEPGPPVVVVREPGTLTVLSLDTGEQRFTMPLHAGGTAPMVADGKVLTVAAPALLAHDLVTGVHRWTAQLEAGPLTMLAAAGPDVLMAATAPGAVAGVDVADGRVLWRARAPSLQRLIDLRDGRVAAVTGLSVRLFDRNGPMPETPLPTGIVRDTRPAGPGELLAVIGGTVQRLDVTLGGETWSLNGLPRVDAVVWAGAPSGPKVVTALQRGTLLVAFAAPPPPRPRTHGCPEARPSEALGGVDAWRGHRALIGVPPAQDRVREILVGLPGAEHGTRFTVSGRRAGVPGASEYHDLLSFRHHDDQDVFVARLEVREGARASTGWPPHWSLLVHVPSPGCWLIQVRTPEGADTVTVPFDLPAGP